eukprot:TRINITY_DN29913_c0_g1_i1.p1 TRINITY_DN29913_c0_g1~~TRINITY_DN29913_c0_g1_i1.p1  ORF type:complete len:493 (+),score=105.99 TRINITY_DN29913_c0_g1_i1:64-1479(+)
MEGSTDATHVRHHFTIPTSTAAALAASVSGPRTDLPAPQLQTDAAGSCVCVSMPASGFESIEPRAEVIPLLPGTRAAHFDGYSLCVSVPFSDPRPRPSACFCLRLTPEGWNCDTFEVTGAEARKLRLTAVPFDVPAVSVSESGIMTPGGDSGDPSLRCQSCFDTLVIVCNGGAAVCTVSCVDETELQLSLKWHTRGRIPAAAPFAASQQYLFLGVGSSVSVYFPSDLQGDDEAHHRTIPLATAPGATRRDERGRGAEGAAALLQQEDGDRTTDRIRQLVTVAGGRVVALTEGGRLYVIAVALPFKDAAVVVEAVAPPRTPTEPHVIDHVAVFPTFLDPLVPSSGCLAALACGTVMLLCPLAQVLDVAARHLRSSSSRRSQQQHAPVRAVPGDAGPLPEKLRGVAEGIEVPLRATSAQWLAQDIASLAMAPPRMIFAMVAGDPLMHVFGLNGPQANEAPPKAVGRTDNALSP